MEQETSSTKKKFAWIPKKLNDGTWIWLNYYEHTIIKEVRPIIRCIMDKDYLHACVENLRKQNNGN